MPPQQAPGKPETAPAKGLLGAAPILDAVAICALAIVCGVLMATRPGNAAVTAILTGVQGVLFLGWGWAAWRLAKRRKDWERTGWLLFAACVPLALAGSLVAWALGANLSVESTTDPVTSLLSVVLYVALFAGLLALNLGQAQSTDGWRRGLDAAIIAGALFFVLWGALYRDSYEASPLPVADRVGVLLIPIFDAALVTLATLALAVPDATRPRGYGYVLAGLIILLVGDVATTTLKLAASPWAAPVTGTTGVAAMGLFALAALVIVGQQPWSPRPHREVRLWVRLLPVIALAPAMGSAVITILQHGALTSIQFWNAFSVIGLVLVQLALTVRQANNLEIGLRSESDFKTQLLRFIAHEVANPISPLRVQVSILGKSSPPGHERAWDIVNRSIDRLTSLSRDVREMALAETQRLVTHVEVVDLADQSATAAQAAVPLAQQRGLELIMHMPLEPLPVRADLQRLGQVLDNLLSNALKFTQAPGKITVRVEQTGGLARVQVTDTGIGLSAADRDGLFQPFRRAQDGAAPGLGLGLYLCKAIVTELHGSIGVESPGRGQGATFWVTLPLEGTDPDPLPLGRTQAAPPVVEPVPVATVKLA